MFYGYMGRDRCGLCVYIFKNIDWMLIFCCFCLLSMGANSFRSFIYFTIDGHWPFGKDYLLLLRCYCRCCCYCCAALVVVLFNFLLYRSHYIYVYNTFIAYVEFNMRPYLSYLIIISSITVELFRNRAKIFFLSFFLSLFSFKGVHTMAFKR